MFPRDGGAATRRCVARGEINDDAQVLSAARQFQYGIGQAGLRAENGAIRFREIHHELALEINAFAGKAAIGEVTQITQSDQPPDRHFAGWIRFPNATARRGSEQVIRRARRR